MWQGYSTPFETIMRGTTCFQMACFCRAEAVVAFPEQSMPFLRHLGIFLSNNEFFFTKLKKKEIFKYPPNDVRTTIYKFVLILFLVFQCPESNSHY